MLCAPDVGLSMKLGLSILAMVLGIFAARGLSATFFGPPSLSHNRVMSSPTLPQSTAMSSRHATPASKPVYINKVKGFGSRP
jgi:hypothetical protein